ncbi:unnamed protein product [Jaminaea pallidilutea]
MSLTRASGIRTSAVAARKGLQATLGQRSNSSASKPSPSQPQPQQPQQQQQQQQPHPFFQPKPRRTGPPSRHALVYREIWPPLLRCLGYGSAAYFGLHLLWQYLDGEEQKKLEEESRSSLEAKVKEARQRIGAAAGSSKDKDDRSRASWWKFWAK